jgi:hypothetical protein
VLAVLRDGGDAAQAAAAGLRTWLEEGRDGSEPPCRHTATRWCFRGCADPFAWRPELDLPWLPAPDEPLAVRLVRWIDDWAEART